MHQVLEQVVSIEDFIRLREVSGLSPRPRKAAEKALPRSLFGVQIKMNSKTIGMGRVVGDGALNFEIVDIAVDPEYQGKGFGRVIMEYIMKFLDREAPRGAYITLMADLPDLYKKFGFKLCRPESEGMYLIK